MTEDVSPMKKWWVFQPAMLVSGRVSIFDGYFFLLVTHILKRRVCFLLGGAMSLSVI